MEQTKANIELVEEEKETISGFNNKNQNLSKIEEGSLELSKLHTNSFSTITQ